MAAKWLNFDGAQYRKTTYIVLQKNPTFLNTQEGRNHSVSEVMFLAETGRHARDEDDVLD